MADHRVERMTVALTEYHRWLAEFPAVARVLENLFQELHSRPMQHASVAEFKGVSALRDELRKLAASGGGSAPELLNELYRIAMYGDRGNSSGTMDRIKRVLATHGVAVDGEAQREGDK